MFLKECWQVSRFLLDAFLKKKRFGGLLVEKLLILLQKMGADLMHEFLNVTSLRDCLRHYLQGNWIASGTNDLFFVKRNSFLPTFFRDGGILANAPTRPLKCPPMLPMKQCTNSIFSHCRLCPLDYPGSYKEFNITLI